LSFASPRGQASPASTSCRTPSPLMQPFLKTALSRGRGCGSPPVVCGGIAVEIRPDVRGRIERVLAWATVAGYRSGDNRARWTGHLKDLLPPKAKVGAIEHHNALPYRGVYGPRRCLGCQKPTGGLRPLACHHHHRLKELNTDTSSPAPTNPAVPAPIPSA
jgi:hypothetical protein